MGTVAYCGQNGIACCRVPNVSAQATTFNIPQRFVLSAYLMQHSIVLVSAISMTARRRFMKLLRTSSDNYNRTVSFHSQPTKKLRGTRTLIEWKLRPRSGHSISLRVPHCSQRRLRPYSVEKLRYAKIASETWNTVLVTGQLTNGTSRMAF